MNRDERHLRRRKDRQRRAAAQRLKPIRGQAGRQLRSRSLRPRRVVGVGRFAQGMTRPTSKPRSRLMAWLLTALPVVILVVWVVARVTRHL